MNRDNTTTDLASLIVGELIERGLVPNCEDTDDPRELEVQDAIKHILDMEMPPISIDLYGAYKKDFLLVPTLVSAMHWGIDKSFAERDENLEKQLKEEKESGRINLVAPQLQHRLVGDAKALLDDLYS